MGGQVASILSPSTVAYDKPDHAEILSKVESDYGQLAMGRVQFRVCGVLFTSNREFI